MDLARKAASEYLRSQGFSDEAGIVEMGGGDDFLEVRIASSLLNILKIPAPKSTPKFTRRLVGEEC